PSVYDADSVSTKAVGIDLMIHIGMHPDEKGYFVERRARRGKYEQPGDDGKYLARDALKGLPEKLMVGFDLDDIAAQVAESDEKTIVKASNDAGLYFCELISFISLSILEQRREFARVVFLHVPTGKDEENIKRGVRVAQALIEACVDSLPGQYNLPH
ncbi:MAG: hypothetical protein Q9218_007193, partial [Villophora microphyllina]